MVSDVMLFGGPAPVLPGGGLGGGTGGLGGAMDMGPPPEFVAFGVLIVLAGIVMTVWRVSVARKMARDAGMDPDNATAMTLLSDNGLDTTYLASVMRPRQAAANRPALATGDAGGSVVLPGRSATDRLRELDDLRGAGLVTTEEYDAARKAILGSL